MGRKDIQRMRLIARKVKMVVMVLVILLTMIVPATDVPAAMIKTIATDTIELAGEEEFEQDTDLSNSYKKLEEKYQREKDFSRSVIYTLIFVIAILIVININIIVYYRRKSEDDFDDSFKEQKADIEPVQKTETKPIEKKEERPKKEPTKKVEEVPDKTEKAPAKVKKTSAKVEVANKFEVFDFNDED